jgi:Flp pilus assembly CpaF family ATPase
MSDGMTDMIEENAYEEQRRLNLGVGKVRSDGSTASYYELPNNASELQDLISAKNMNAQIGLDILGLILQQVV